jgi:hypothetical protein
MTATPVVRCAMLVGVMYFLAGSVAYGAEAAKLKPLVAPLWIKAGDPGASEVVIEPDAEKLKARGLTREELAKALRGRRFGNSEWTLDIKGKKIDLEDVAKLTVRELYAPPFTVTLRDGREVQITPDPKAIGNYVVTGEYFEEDVREALSTDNVRDPAEYHVMSGISVPGTVVPHATEPGTMRHISMGEPLKAFATVEVYAAKAKPKK